MLSHESFDHVFAHIARDLAARYEGVVPAERVEAIVQDARAELEPGSHHPEFLAGLVEHAAKERLHALVEPATT
ncbi:three-helix bundle dimerization domain-containing protein [Janibacter sp. GXQ6167]|uniref:three-helix bundle dimerization domain-containing protein n=1 Tax=Janibacter sp. GXQ6167 TaxID=3240791 RepID=UPI003525B425